MALDRDDHHNDTDLQFGDQDFAHEAYNADRVRNEFLHLKGKTSLYIPEILWAERRCMAMECESGGFES